MNLANLQPVKVEYKVPDKTVVEPDPVVSIWDQTEEGWSQDHISDINYVDKTNTNSPSVCLYLE